METVSTNSLTKLYGELKRRPEVRALIPLGYIAGMPIITIKNDQLVAVVPFLRYKATGVVDRTLVFPIRYTLEYLLPECQPVGFRDLSIEPAYADYDFEKVIGFFRHDAVKHMDRTAYTAFRASTLSKMDHLVNYLTGNAEDFSAADDQEIASALRTIIEPFVAQQYEALDSDFYNKYLKD